MNDCNLQLQSDGLFRCEQCRRPHRKFVRRNCPGRIDPAEVARQKARAEACESCPDLQRRNGGDFCRIDEIGMPELTVCQLLARFGARIRGKIEDCQRQKKRRPVLEHVFFLGYPGDTGGANTECWHLVKLWRSAGIGVGLVPTWRADPDWESRLSSIGAWTIPQKPRDLQFPAGSIVVGMCNAHYVGQARRLREAGHRLIYSPCMNWTSDPELRYLIAGGRMDAWVFQSLYQRQQWRSTLEQFGQLDRSRVIRGAFDVEDFPLNPRDRGEGDPFVVGRLSRADPTKFHPRTWEMLGRVPNCRARVMAWNSRVERKLGPPPPWAEVLAPAAEPVREFLASLHCLVQLNDEAVENWPRVGLEAMAAGVPVIADNRGGWCEMIEHGQSGYLVESIDEAAWYAGLLARDRQQRMAIILAGRKRVEDLSRPEPILAGWKDLFEELRCESPIMKA